MRTPNTVCVICGKPLYRRPAVMERARFAACMEHRSQAQVAAGITPAQQAGLALGRTDNHRNGRPDTDDTKRKKSEAIRAYWREHPDEAVARARRGEDAWNWRGGVTRLNTSIRLMNEYRKWTRAVRMRDGSCVRCGSTRDLEAHHLTPLADLLAAHGITDRNGARACDALWDSDNGMTLCRACHYAEHGRGAVCA